MCESDSSIQVVPDPSVIYKDIFNTVQNKIRNFIVKICKEPFQAEIQATDFVSATINETTDVFDKSQVPITFRYI